MKKPHVTFEDGPQVLEGIKGILSQTKTTAQELRDQKEAQRIVRKTAKRVAREVKETNFPSALEGVKVTRRLQAKTKATKKAHKNNQETAA